MPETPADARHSMSPIFDDLCGGTSSFVPICMSSWIQQLPLQHVLHRKEFPELCLPAERNSNVCYWSVSRTPWRRTKASISSLKTEPNCVITHQSLHATNQSQGADAGILGKHEISFENCRP